MLQQTNATQLAGHDSTWRKPGQTGTGWDRKQQVLDAAYEEYARLIESGQKASMAEIAARYPTYSKSIVRALEVYDTFEEAAAFEGNPMPEAGDQFLGFDIVAELGSGSMAKVYLATEPALGNREVVVKVSLRGDHEAETLGKLNHRNIVPVHSVRRDERGERTAVCMPYLGSTTLSDVLELLFGAGGRPAAGNEILTAIADRERSPDFAQLHRAEFPPSRILKSGTYVEAVAEMGIQLADALEFTAARQVLHRDLKPSNILVTPSGTPMLLDFNLSLEGDREARLVGGTLPYMPPELIQEVFLDPHSPSAPDHRSDLFALGVVLFELLTGRVPFGSPHEATPEESARVHLSVQPQRASVIQHLRRRVPRLVADPILQCLELDPGRRPASAGVLAEGLRRYFAPAQLAKRELIKRRRSVMLGGLGTLAAGVAAAGYWSTRPSEEERLFRAGLASLQSGFEREQAGDGEDQFRQEFQTAVAQLSRSLEKKIDAPHVALARAIAYLNVEDYGSAVHDLLVVQQVDDNTDVRDCLGYAHLGLRRFNEAATIYSIAADSAESVRRRAELLVNAAHCFSRHGELPTAHRTVSRAIEHDPTFQLAYHLRIFVATKNDFQQYRDPDEVVHDVQTARQLGPTSWLLDYHAAWALHGAATGSSDSLGEQIIELLQSSARGGARENAFRAPWIAEWTDPLELQATRKRYPPAPAMTQNDPFVTRPNFPRLLQHVAMHDA